MHMSSDSTVLPSLVDPIPDGSSDLIPEPQVSGSNSYERTVSEARELLARPRAAGSGVHVLRQHAKNRMTVWERMDVLCDRNTRPELLFQNWGPNLDGASLVTAVVRIQGRDVAMYGHDFTVRAGSMDATNGRKLANLFRMAGEKGIPLIGMNDSAGAFVPAGVGGLDGYSEAFTALRKISGVVPSIMCMFGYNAGGGSYLPRQGSFVIQPHGTFFGLTGAAVVKSVLGEDVSPDELGGPSVHGGSGVADVTVPDEVGALRTACRLLSYLPNSNREVPMYEQTSDPLERRTTEIDTLLRKAFNSPTGFNTPFDVSIVIQQICDHGDYFEIQAGRARNVVTAFGRLGGHVAGFVASNSAVASGQIDVDAAYKISRFVRFCNLYNTPLIFLEDTTGFLPGREQEMRGIVQAGRSMLDAIIDVRTPRILLILRNAFGGAYASFNPYPTGADLVLALPTTRVAVMGPAGKEYVYKKELRAIHGQAKLRLEQGDDEHQITEWVKTEEEKLNHRYERELMNPREALSLGSISGIVMPSDLRATLGSWLVFFLRRYQPGPMTGTQREFL
jgi:acetyl-CoA carboxylase carboxyltransferase component